VSGAFEKVVVGVDEGAGGRAAATLARVLAPDAELVLAHVAPDATSGAGATELLAGVRDAAGATARLVTLAGGSPAEALHELAEREGADLLVVGATHRGALARILGGDQTRAALREAPCAVAVAPAGFAGTPLRRVGVAFDDSPASHAALALAARFAASVAAGLHVVSAVDFGPLADGSGLDIAELTDIVREQRQADLDEAVADVGVPAEAVAVSGYAGPAIGRLAGEVDVLFCGSRGRGALGRLLHGSISDSLAHDPRLPVVIVGRDAAR
jgi:nucleotide-binding universal stress UspA family protein